MPKRYHKTYLHEDIELSNYAVKKLKKFIVQDEVGKINEPDKILSAHKNAHVSADESGSSTKSICKIEQTDRNVSPFLKDGNHINNDDSSIFHVVDNTEELIQSSMFDVSSQSTSDNDELSMSEVSSKITCADDELFDLLKQEKDSNRLNIINNPQFYEKLLIHFTRSPAEVLLMVIKYSLQYKLPIVGITNMLKMINILCDQKIIPDTRYFIDKITNIGNIVTLHGVCTVCYNDLGTFEELGDKKKCDRCDHVNNTANPSDRCYFAFIDPSNSLRHYLELHENYYNYVIKERQHEKNHIKDIFDGKLYRNFVKNLNIDDKHRYATVTFNTDGAPVFKSSKQSIWPLYLIINELPIQDRLVSPIVCGLWFGLNKPDMHSFLSVFVDMMNELSTKGVQCNIKSENCYVKVFPLVACVDTIARSPMNGTIQFNGHYGCDWCLHPGEYYGGSTRYPYLDPSSPQRTKELMIDWAVESIDTGKIVYGVKSASPLINLSNFDITNGFTPDYLHCYLSGVIKQHTEVILRDFTKDDILVMDDELLKIKAPHHIGRLSRPLSFREKWKAREFENWCLYYSVPILENKLNHRTMKLWSLLVQALHICLQDDITKSDLKQLKKLLIEYVTGVEDMYDLTFMTYNVHQLLHIAKSIYDWGPVWAHSTFPFEAANHKLLTAIHSGKGVISQIIRYLNLYQVEQKLEKHVYPDCSGPVQNYCKIFLNSKTQQAFKIFRITYFGRGKCISSIDKRIANWTKSAECFSKAVINGCLFASSNKVNSRSCNYYAQLENKDFIKVKNFVVDYEKRQEFVICSKLETRPNRFCGVIYEVSSISDIIALDTNSIAKICCYIEINNKAFIIPLPNMLSF